MKEFFEIIWAGLMGICMASYPILCFYATYLCFTRFLDAIGFIALLWFLGVILTFAFGIVFLCIIGVAVKGD